jgi:hypothetical protein
LRKPDNVMIDKLLLCLRKTLYYEGVVIDSHSGCRPASIAAALTLLDKRHDVLSYRGQAHEGKGKAPMTAPSPKPPGQLKRPGAGTPGPSSAAPPGKKAKTLDPHIYLSGLHNIAPARMAELKQSIADRNAGRPTRCLLCGGPHFLTSCARHTQQLADNRAARAAKKAAHARQGN